MSVHRVILDTRLTPNSYIIEGCRVDGRFLPEPLDGWWEVVRIEKDRRTLWIAPPEPDQPPVHEQTQHHDGAAGLWGVERAAYHRIELNGLRGFVERGAHQAWIDHIARTRWRAG